MEAESTFTATIYVGAKERYDGIIHTYEEAKEICQNFCDKFSFCVTLTSTEIIYKNGNESGFIVGLINYPRFSVYPEDLKDTAIDIAKIFMKKFNQLRIIIVCSDETYMIENFE